ncbi:PREDICTED: fasciclin-like arabinogalactan protein 13 [Populus euphratica]|uniref:Fasciclin-like arabinogalactan protein 13 n=1 Tax=Populus euphratica TaxID=75702 RepID=A0AAJ6T7C3_POPEU|nr:PREDICTED: fasciclin-like arabinogalactan protein 13 [Populus euphratica]
MATTPLSFFLLSLLLSLSLNAQAQTPTAPAPMPSGPVNFTAVLVKGGQFTTLIRLLNKTQTFNQIENQLNSSSEGMTIFAPTDNAFNNLKAGALNGLNQQEQVQLLQYHTLPKFYTTSNLLLVSNPVPTQASGQDGVWGLNFTGQSNQVNVSTGLVEVQINNALRQDFPLAPAHSNEVPPHILSHKSHANPLCPHTTTKASTMATTPLSFFLLSLLLSLSLNAQAQTPTAPAPMPSGPVNFTAVLVKGGQFATLIRLLNKTQTFNQIENQLNSSSEGMTIFAPISWWKECSIGIGCWARFDLHGNSFLIKC